MIKANNSYLVLGIPCDEYGRPLREVTNYEINEKYLQKLFQLYLKYDELALIEKEKIEETRKLKAKGVKDKEEIDRLLEMYKRSDEIRVKRQMLREKDNDFFKTICSDKLTTDSIVLLESLIENHQFVQQNANFKQVFEFYQTAFYSVNSTEKRKEYDELIEEENHRQFLEFAEKNKVDLSQKEFTNEDLLYLGIHKDVSEADKLYDLLYKSDDCILLVNDRFFLMTAVQKEKESDIKRKAVLKKKELNEYVLLLKQGKIWKNYKFISGKQTENIFNSDISAENKNIYFKLLVTALKNMILKGRPMIGVFKANKEGKFEELDDIKLFEKVAEYNRQRNSIKGELNKWVR